MTLEIDQQKKEVVIRLPLGSSRASGTGGKATTIAADEAEIPALLDNRRETFRVRASVEYHRSKEGVA